MSYLARIDPEIYDAIFKETNRQITKLELIASENFVSEAVLEAPKISPVNGPKSFSAASMSMSSRTRVRRPIWRFISLR
jgi:hypothetical protein